MAQCDVGGINRISEGAASEVMVDSIVDEFEGGIGGSWETFSVSFCVSLQCEGVQIRVQANTQLV